MDRHPDIRLGQSIAIVGIGCRFPGGVNSPQSFWQLLLDQVDAIQEIPQDRFDIHTLYDPRPAVPGKIMTRWGGYLDNIDKFDAAFFGISPREADRLDPQQRLLLEVGWEAIEDAGEVLGSSNLLNGGAFVGVWLNDYETRLFRDPAKIDFYMTTGSGRYSVAGRLSYFLGMQGPSLTVDTACSSSLVAVHLACQSLRQGECSLALAGGTSVILQPAITIAYSQSRMMAQDGRCKFGDARGDGYVRSEGTALIALKRLEDAIADGNPIYAIIKGSAVNNDGRSSGFLTTPGGAGQEDLLRKAYQNAGISPGQVQYIEAHGTGTRAGDPVEIGAIGAVVQDGRAKGAFCRVGSVKTNFGHTEGAAGVAGLIKVALSLKHRFLPASLHFQTPNPGIPWDRLPVRIQAQAEPWPEHDGPAFGGVSAFGIAGTNAHVVLEEAPDASQPSMVAARRASGTPYLIPLSARSPAALRDQATALRQWLSNGDAPPLQDIAYTASVRRSHHDHRAAFTATSLEDLNQQLLGFAESWQAENIQQVEAAERKILFVFPGQGSQWVGMGRQLLDREPAFRQALEQCSAAIQPHTGWSLIDILRSDEVKERLEQIDFIQPALFAMQASLAILWRAYGIEPAAVAGHSLGEVAAAFIAGILSLEDAARVICKRSQLMKTISGKGAMLATDLSYDGAQEVLAGYENRVSIAVSNSPQSTVLSGDVDALEEITASLQSKNVFCRPVKVDVAAHSPQMEALRPLLEQSLQGLKTHPAPLKIYSTVTGKAEESAFFDIAYWGRNLRQPVLFSSVLQQALADGIDTVIEISPHPVLLQAVEQGFRASKSTSEKPRTALPSTRRGEDEGYILLQSIGKLYELGHPLDMRKLVPEGGRCVTLPTYPWQREHFWLEIESPTAAPPAGAHPLSGRPVETAGLPSAIIRELQIDSSANPELFAHRLYNTRLLPASAYVEMVRAAAEEVFGRGLLEINNTVFERALQLQADQKTTLQVVLNPTQNGQYNFQVSSRSAGTWMRHAFGTLRRLEAAPQSDTLPDLSAIRARCQTVLAGQAYYDWLQERAILFEAPLQALQEVRQGSGEAVAELVDPGHAARLLSLDPLFQLSTAALPQPAENAANGVYLPTLVESIILHGPVPGAGIAYARDVVSSEPNGRSQTLFLFGPDGLPQVEMRGVHLQDIGQATMKTTEQWLYELQWQPVERTAPGEPAAIQPGRWLILADRGGQAEALAARLEQAGGQCSLVSADPDPTQASTAIHRALRQEDGRLRGIVYLSSLDVPAHPALDVDQFEAALTATCLNAAEVVRNISESSSQEGPRVWVITRGAQPTSVQPPAIAQAALWGLGRVIAEEHPDVWGGLIDIDPAADCETVAQLLAAEILDPQETQLAFAGGQRLALRLVRYQRKVDSSATYHFSTDAAYLITGGLGGIGLEVARWMILQGARRLILMNRTPLPPRNTWARLTAENPFYEKVKAIRSLEAKGAVVHLAAVDVGDEAALHAWLEEYNNEGWPTIRGVLHTAGVVSDRLVAQMTREEWDVVMRPKVRGGWLLHQLLPDLDLFVLFSSIGSVFGPTGQGNYATANAFLDGLAHYRRAVGLPAISVNWGFWDAIGMARMGSSQQTQQLMEQQGFVAFNAAQGTEALGMLLADAPVQATVMGARWEQVRTARLSISRANLFKTLIVEDKSAQPGTGEAQTETKESPRDTLLALPADQRAAYLAAFLQGQVAQVLKLPPTRIPLNKPLGPLGLDSLMAIELRGRLESVLNISLSATFIWSYPTLNQMAPFIAGRMNVPLTEEDQTAEPAAVETQDGDVASLDMLDNLFDNLLSGIEGLTDDSARDTLQNE